MWSGEHCTCVPENLGQGECPVHREELKKMNDDTPSFFQGDREYTHRICPNRHVAKVRKDHDWSEQDVCPRCDEMYDLYDPKRKRTAAQDGFERKAGGLTVEQRDNAWKRIEEQDARVLDLARDLDATKAKLAAETQRADENAERHAACARILARAEARVKELEERALSCNCRAEI